MAYIIIIYVVLLVLFVLHSHWSFEISVKYTNIFVSICIQECICHVYYLPINFRIVQVDLLADVVRQNKREYRILH